MLFFRFYLLNDLFEHFIVLFGLVILSPALVTRAQLHYGVHVKADNLRDIRKAHGRGIEFFQALNCLQVSDGH